MCSSFVPAFCIGIFLIALGVVAGVCFFNTLSLTGLLGWCAHIGLSIATVLLVIMGIGIIWMSWDEAPDVI